MSEDPSWDEYFIPGTQVLRNKFTGGGELPYGVDSERALQALEEHRATLRLIELRDNPILGLFDYDHMKAIHRHIFQDVYEWAGVERTTLVLWRQCCPTPFVPSPRQRRSIDRLCPSRHAGLVPSRRPRLRRGWCHLAARMLGAMS